MGNFSEILSVDADVYKLRIIFGVTSYAFSNSRHSQILREKLPNLNARNAFGCITNFLFHTSEVVFHRVINTWQKITQPGVISIAIHQRWGDDALFGTNTNVDIERLNLQRVQQLEDYLLLNNSRKVVWVYFCDSIEAKKYVKENYQEKVLVTNVTPSHIEGVKVPTIKGTKDMDRVQNDTESSITSFADWWLFSSCKYYVFDANSGFPRTAYAYSIAINPHALINRNLGNVRLVSIEDCNAGSGL